MRLLAASIVILLLAFSLAHAGKFKDQGGVSLFQCLKAQQDGMEIYDESRRDEKRDIVYIDKAFWVEGGGSLNGSIYVLLGKLPYGVNSGDAELDCYLLN